jgi:hypothetical protein
MPIQWNFMFHYITQHYIRQYDEKKYIYIYIYIMEISLVNVVQLYVGSYFSIKQRYTISPHNSSA